MKFVFKQKKVASYESLKNGDLFTRSGDIFMRTDELGPDSEDCGYCAFKSVNLSNGKMESFGRHTTVVRLEGELYIDYPAE